MTPQDLTILHESGFRLLVLEPQKKTPIKGVQWGVYVEREQKLENILSYFASHPDNNVGIATGQHSGITVVDIDLKKNSLDWAHAFIDKHKTPLVVRTVSGGYHLYYRYDPSVRNGVALSVDGGYVDIRNDRGFVVAPPSVVKDDAKALNGVYKWLVDDIALLPLYASELPALPVLIGRSAIKDRYQKISPAFFQKTLIPEGERHAYMASLIGKMLVAFLDTSDWLGLVYNSAMAVNQCYLSPPLGEPELQRIYRDLSTRELNRRKNWQKAQLQAPIPPLTITDP